MSKYQCPLCNQEVSKVLYEKITGIWQEKEKQMANLKEKEKNLKAKEQKMLAQFATEKKQIVNHEKAKYERLLSAQQKEILRERDSFKRERAKIDGWTLGSMDFGVKATLYTLPDRDQRGRP